MKRRWLIALIAGAVIIPLIAFASVRGKMIQLGIDSDGSNITIAGDLRVAGTNIGLTADTDLLTLAANLVTVAGGITVTGNQLSSGTLTLTGAALMRSTLGITGVLDANSTVTISVLGEHKVRILSFTGSKTLTAAMSGAIISNQDAATSSVLTLPTAVAGLTYTFLDVEAAADSDLWITAGASDKINGGTAQKSYKCTGDAVKQHVTIVAIDDELWEITAENGTWANDNS